MSCLSSVHQAKQCHLEFFSWKKDEVETKFTSNKGQVMPEQRTTAGKSMLLHMLLHGHVL